MFFKGDGDSKLGKDIVLNPKRGEISKIIDANQSKDGGFIEKHLYNVCLKCVQKEKYSTIQEVTVYGSIRMFLMNWGMMGRVLNRDENKGWEARLVKKIPELSDKLEKFRTMKLEDIDLSQFEEDINTCYQQISNIVAPTSAAKTLHLLCPNFFPLWDKSIRDHAREKDGRRGWTGIKGYYFFIDINQIFLGKYNDELSALSNKYGRPKLRIIDEYFHSVTRK